MKASQSLIGVALGLVLTACVSSPQKPEAAVPPAAPPAPPRRAAKASPSPAESAFLRPSTLPYEMPPFDQITDASYRPAFEAGMAEQRGQVAAIANDRRAADVREHDRRAGAFGSDLVPGLERVFQPTRGEHQR